MTSALLKPCPFCGGEAELDEHQEYRNINTGERESAIAVYCATCGAQHSICRGDVPDVHPAEVIELWNRRATSPVAEAVTEAMVEAAVQAVRQYTRETLFIDEHRELVRAALKAAMEAEG